MTTVSEIKNAASSFSQWPGFDLSRDKRYGEVLKFTKPITVTACASSSVNMPLIRAGEIYDVEGAGISGKYQGYLHIVGVPYWWNANIFKLG